MSYYNAAIQKRNENISTLGRCQVQVATYASSGGHLFAILSRCVSVDNNQVQVAGLYKEAE